MLHVTTAANSKAQSRNLVDRVRAIIVSLGCTGVWARAVGTQVLLGLGDEVEPFARLASLRGGSFGLAFRGADSAWEPLLLVDQLDAIVEHALVAVDALPV